MKQPKWWQVTLQVNGSEYQTVFHIQAASITQTASNSLLIDGRELVYAEDVESFQEELSPNILMSLTLLHDKEQIVLLPTT